MSFDANPNNYDYSAAPKVCPACFAAGETPEKIFLCLSGILQGALWGPADPPPMNGIWELTADGPCSWVDNIVGITIDFDPSPGATRLAVLDTAPNFHFTYNQAPVCQIWFPNDQNVPAGQFFYAGFCMIIDPTVTGILTTDEILTLFNFPYHDTLWTNPRPKSAEETVYTMSSRADKTNIKILVDHS